MIQLPPRPRSIVIALVFVLTVLQAPAAWADTSPIAGHWEGEIAVPGSPLVIKVDLEQVDGAWAGSIDIPQQDATGLALVDVVVEATAVRFRIQGVPGDPTFNGRLDGDTIRGKFGQGGATFDFELGREAVAGPRRPQNPQPPFPYTSEDVSYANGAVQLAATLTLPSGEGPFPALVLITGSGAQDRNETVFGHQPFWVLADHLTRAGIAVLRADDRGVGGSTGDVNASTSSDFAEDALAGVRYLSSRPEIDNQRIGLLGHSEGGLVAPLAAARSEQVALVVLLAAPGVPGTEILAHQTALIRAAEGGAAEGAEQQAVLMRQALDWLSVETDPERLRRRLLEIARQQIALAPAAEQQQADNPELLEKSVEALLTPWFRFFLTYDPATALRLLRVPVLVVTGELDLQVDPEQNMPAIETALEQGGNADTTTRVLPGLNHLFQHTETGRPSEYATIEETLAPELLELVTSWLLERWPLQDESDGS